MARCNRGGIADVGSLNTEPSPSQNPTVSLPFFSIECLAATAGTLTINAQFASPNGYPADLTLLDGNATPLVGPSQLVQVQNSIAIVNVTTTTVTSSQVSAAVRSPVTFTADVNALSGGAAPASSDGYVDF